MRNVGRRMGIRYEESEEWEKRVKRGRRARERERSRKRKGNWAEMQGETRRGSELDNERKRREKE